VEFPPPPPILIPLGDCSLSQIVHILVFLFFTIHKQIEQNIFWGFTQNRNIENITKLKIRKNTHTQSYYHTTIGQDNNGPSLFFWMRQFGEPIGWTKEY
jgi:hypothetical protein